MTVGAVVVLFHPDPALLHRQFLALSEQVDRVVYVDNADGRAGLAAAGIAGDRVAVIGDGENLGLARALNAGVAVSVDAADAWAVLLLDQDSVPAPGMVGTLAASLSTAQAGNPPVAAIGPAISDALLAARPEFIRMRPLFTRRRRMSAHADAGPPFEVDFLVTSGTLVDLAAWHDIGGMDESLFIDSLDLEWGFRALHRGYRLLGTFATTLEHRRGDKVMRVPVLPPIRLHAPSRLYWMHRNRVLLYRRAYVPWSWKVQDVGRMLAKLGLLVAFVPGRRATVGAVVRGLLDGARGSAPRPDRW